MILFRKAAVAAFSLSLFAAALPAQAAEHVSVDFGNIAFAYSDGYWDHDHHWHRWHKGDLARYRKEHRDDYHGWKHDRDPDHGWHDR